VEFDDNAARSYASADRDVVIGSLLDAVHRSGNKRVEVTASGSSDQGLRLTPRFYTEEVPRRGGGRDGGREEGREEEEEEECARVSCGPALKHGLAI
jgi:hypothetical protein